MAPLFMHCGIILAVHCHGFEQSPSILTMYSIAGLYLTWRTLFPLRTLWQREGYRRRQLSLPGREKHHHTLWINAPQANGSQSHSLTRVLARNLLSHDRIGSHETPSLHTKMSSGKPGLVTVRFRKWYKWVLLLKFTGAAITQMMQNHPLKA